MIIKFTNFSDGIHSLEFDVPAEKLNLSSEFIDNVLINCEMDKSPSQIVLNCDVNSKVHLTCDRCNAEYDDSINHTFRMIYMLDQEGENEEGTNIHYLSRDKDKIDLTEDVRELTMLELPLKHLCNYNCKGLCIKCGKNLNEGKCNCKIEEINPVWEPLLKLKDKLNN